MRHPDVLKFMDAVETDTTIYIMTEPVRPLAAELQSMSGKSVQDKQDWLLWGLHRITVRIIYHSIVTFDLDNERAVHGLAVYGLEELPLFVLLMLFAHDNLNSTSSLVAAECHL